MFREIGEESPERGLNPKTLLDSPIPGEFYPRRSLRQVFEGISSLRMQIQAIMDSDGDTRIASPKTGETYWLDTNGRLKIVNIQNRKRLAYFYDEQGRLCGKRVEEHNIDRLVIIEFNRFIYDSPESKDFRVTPLVFNDGIGP